MTGASELMRVVRLRAPGGPKQIAVGIRDKPETAVGTMMTDVLEAIVPGYVRPNVCDDIQNSPFET